MMLTWSLIQWLALKLSRFLSGRIWRRMQHTFGPPGGWVPFSCLAVSTFVVFRYGDGKTDNTWMLAPWFVSIIWAGMVAGG